MRPVLTFLLLMVCFFCNAQIQFDKEINEQLEGKIKISEIEATVIAYYNKKLKQCALIDTTCKKKLLRQLKFWNRKLWQSSLYTNEKGIEQNMHVINQNAINELLRIANTSRYQPTEWQISGPVSSDNGIGRVDKIAFHPFDNNIIFAGSANGGLFKTIDNGSNWFPITQFLPSLGISGIAINPFNPDIMYVLTGDANTGSGCFPGNVCLNTGEYVSASTGIYKSVDGGNNWFFLFNFSLNMYRGQDLAIDATNPNILYAATTAGLFKTTNAGSSWNLINGNVISDIEFKPTDPATLYCATSSGVLLTTNGGMSFTSTLFNPASFRNSLAVSPADPNRLYVLSSNDMTTLFLVSIDSGLSFSVSSTQHITEAQSSFNHCLAAHPGNSNILYSGGLNVWSSTNGGFNWIKSSEYWPWDSPYMHPDIHDLKFHPVTSQLWCANDGGVYLNENGGWTPKFNGLSITQFYKFERRNNLGQVWGGTQDNGIQRQISGGNFVMHNTGDGYDEMTDHNYLVGDGESDNTYFAVNNKIYKSCFPSLCDISVDTNNHFFGNLAMSYTNENRIYTGYFSGLWQSNNAGDDWTKISAQPANWCVSSTNNDSILYFAGSNGLFKYIQGSVPFSINPDPPYNINLKITDIDVNRLNKDHIYVSIAGTQQNAKVYGSTNGGITWQNLSYNLPNVPILCIKLDANNGLYIGTTIGVFYKPNGYTYWQPFSNGLPPVTVTEIELYPEPNPINGNLPPNPPAIPEIWISTFGRGIWYTQQYTFSCSFNLTLSGQPGGNRLEEAINNITSTQLIQNDSNTIKYNASNRITLSPGFKVNSGSRFKTYLNGCGGNVDD